MARDFCDVENELRHRWMSLGKECGKGFSRKFEGFDIGSRFHICNRGDPTKELDLPEEGRSFSPHK